MPPSESELARKNTAFRCSCTHDDADVAWIRVAGALDCATAPELGRTLADAQGRAALAVLDLSELSFIDCAGMHTIVEASSRARRSGRRLVLVGGDPAAYRLFTLTGSVDAVEIVDLDPSTRRRHRVPA